MKSWTIALIGLFILSAIWIPYAVHVEAAPASEFLRVISLAVPSCAVALIVFVLASRTKGGITSLWAVPLAFGVVVAAFSVPQKLVFDAALRNIALCAGHPNSVGCVESQPAVNAGWSASEIDAWMILMMALLALAVVMFAGLRTRRVER